MTTSVRPARRACAAISVLAIAAAAQLAGCTASPMAQPLTGYTCCNLRVNGGWISSENILVGEPVPLGSPATFDAMKRDYYLYGLVDSVHIGLRYDAKSDGDKQTMAWAHKVIVKDDPRATLATWPADVQAAVRSAHVLVGMTREQVVMSLAWPPAYDNPSLDSPTWRYWVGVLGAPVDLNFGADGHLQTVTGSAPAVETILAKS